MNEYPPEVQAVLDAADALLARWPESVWGDPDGWAEETRAMAKAVDAYRKSVAPPEPFEGYVGVYAGRHSNTVYKDAHVVDNYKYVWRVRVEFVERVK